MTNSDETNITHLLTVGGVMVCGTAHSRNHFQSQRAVAILPYESQKQPRGSLGMTLNDSLNLSKLGEGKKIIAGVYTLGGVQEDSGIIRVHNFLFTPNHAILQGNQAVRSSSIGPTYGKRKTRTPNYVIPDSAVWVLKAFDRGVRAGHSHLHEEIKEGLRHVLSQEGIDTSVCDAEPVRWRSLQRYRPVERIGAKAKILGTNLRRAQWAPTSNLVGNIVDVAYPLERKKTTTYSPRVA